MEYIGNRPNPNPTNPNPYQYDDNYWWNYNPYGNIGGYDPYSAPVTSWEQQVQQSGGTAPQNPDVDANGNPVFRTEVTDTAPPVETTPSDIGDIDPYLAHYLASLPQSQGGTGADFSVDTTGFTDPSYPFPGEYPVESYDPNPPPGTPTFTAEGTYKPPPDIVPYPEFKFDPNPPPTYKFDAEGTYKPPPDIVPWPKFEFTPNKPPGTGTDRGFPVSIFPTLDKIKDVITGGGGGGGTGGGGQQQQQKPGVGGLLAALPLLAAFQGGTTTTPAPYAHLGPHTPVKPVFGPQGPGKRIPSIGQLLAGVR